MDNEEKAKIVNELYGSVHDPRNYDKRYYHQQAKETAAVTAIAMIRDGISLVDTRIWVLRFQTMRWQYCEQRLCPTKKPRL